MANPKLFSEFRSCYGHFYLIEIWDDEYTGTSPDQFNVTGEGFQLNYSGQTDNIYSPIIGSSVSFGMYVENSATNTFLNNLKQYQQDRYFVKIWKGEFSGEDANTWYNTSKVSDDGLVMSFSPDEEQVVYLDFHWGGYIVHDIIEVEDVSQPYVLNIQATDGISKLADSLVTTSYQRQFTNQFINALDSANVLGMYGSEHPVLSVVCNWWANEMTYNVNNNPLDETWADFRAFDTIDEDGVITGKTWIEVLEQMCQIFGLRFYYSNGQYRLEQLFTREASSMFEHRYKKDKTKIDSALVSYNKTINQTSNKARLAGNLFNFLPAVNNVSIVSNKEPKAIKGVISDEISQPTTNIGFIASTPANQIFFGFHHIGQVTINTPVSSAKIFMKLRLNVELYDFNTNTTYYLKRTFTGMTPGAISWTTTQAGSGYDVIIGPLQETDRDILLVTGNTSVITPTTPADGDVSFDWEFVEFVKSNGTTHTLNAANQYGWQMETRNLTTTNGEGITNETIRTRAISPNTNIKSNLSYELPETNLFTGSGERGSLVKQVSVGGIDIRIPYTNWREGNAGTYKTIQRLVCEEFLKLMDEPIEKYMGRMYSSHDFRQRLYFDESYWVQLGGTYSANMDEWDGEWFVIRRASITPTFEDVTTKSDVTFFDAVNGITGNTSFSGLDAVNLDTNILDVTTTASVGTNLDVGGDGDFSGRLDVGSDLGVVGNVSATDVQASGNVTAVDVNASGNVSATDLEASGDVLADGAVNADSVSATNSVNGNTLSATTSVSSATLTTTSDATIGRDLSVTRNTDLTGTLDVTSTTTLAGDAVLESTLDHQGKLIQQITDVTNSAGSTYDVGETEYMIFNTWSGGNGTATINLPSAGDNEGRLLRFKSDGTISASKSINMIPGEGETIDGNDEFAFNRDYDGVMLLAHNSNWFIIQRKAK